MRTEQLEYIAAVARLVHAAAARGMARPGENVVIVAGTPYRVSGRTNLIKVETVPPAGQEIPDEF